MNKNMVQTLLAPQLKALRLGISAMERERRRFSPCHVACNQGFRAQAFDQDGVSGVAFLWAEQGEAKYQELEQAIRQLEDLIEILEESAEPSGIPTGQMEFEL